MDPTTVSTTGATLQTDLPMPVARPPDAPVIDHAPDLMHFMAAAAMDNFAPPARDEDAEADRPPTAAPQRDRGKSSGSGGGLLSKLKPRLSSTRTEGGIAPLFLFNRSRSPKSVSADQAHVGPTLPKATGSQLRPLDAGEHKGRFATVTATGVGHVFGHDAHAPTTPPLALPKLLQSNKVSRPADDIADRIPRPQATMADEEAQFKAQLGQLFGGDDGQIDALYHDIVAAMPPATADDRAPTSRSQLPFDKPLMLADALSAVSQADGGSDPDKARAVLQHLQRDPLDSTRNPGRTGDSAQTAAWHARKLLARTAPGRDVALSLADRGRDPDAPPRTDRQTTALGSALEISNWLADQEGQNPKISAGRLRAVRSGNLGETQEMLRNGHRGALAQVAMDGALKLARDPDAALPPDQKAALYAWQNGIQDNETRDKIGARMAKAVEWVDRADRGTGGSWQNVFGKKKNPMQLFAGGPAGLTRPAPSIEARNLDEVQKTAMGALGGELAGKLGTAAPGAERVGLAWRAAAAADWSEQTAKPQPNGQPTRPGDYVFDGQAAQRIHQRAASLLQAQSLPDQDLQGWQDELTTLANLPSGGKADFSLDAMKQWADDAKLGDTSPARQALNAGSAIVNGEEARPASTKAADLKSWFGNTAIPQMVVGNKLQVSQGGAFGLSNTTSPFSLLSAHGVSVAPDLAATRARSAVMSLGASGAAGEYRIGAQHDVTVQLGTQVAFGPNIKPIKIGLSGSAGISASVQRFQGITIRTRRQDDPATGTLEQTLVPQRDEQGGYKIAGRMGEDGTVEREPDVDATTPMVPHPDDPNRMVTAAPRDKWNASLSDVSDFFFDQQDKAAKSGEKPTPQQVWQDFAGKFADRGGVSVSWQDQQSLTPRGKLAGRASARADIHGWGIGGSFSLDREWTAAAGANRADNTGQLRRNVIQINDSARSSLAAAFSFTPKSASVNEGDLKSVGAPGLNAFQRVVTFADRGATASFRPVYENGKLLNSETQRELEFTNLDKFKEFFNRPENRAAFDGVTDKATNDAYLKELEKNYVPGQAMVVRWRLTPEAGDALEQLRIRSDMAQAKAGIARQDGDEPRAKGFEAEAAKLQKAATGLLTADDSNLWRPDAVGNRPANSWDPVGTYSTSTNTTSTRQGPNYVVMAQRTSDVQGTREFATNTAGAMDALRQARAEGTVPLPVPRSSVPENPSVQDTGLAGFTPRPLSAIEEVEEPEPV